MSLTIAKTYRLDQKIGSGAFGEIYLGTHLSTQEKVAVKLERVNTKHPQVVYESKVFKYLQGGVGIPGVIFGGVEPPYNVSISLARCECAHMHTQSLVGERCQ
jgi:casein kinase 1